jgi:ribonuclease T
MSNHAFINPYVAGATSDISKRFRGYLPVVIDVETGGFDCNKHALLEIAVVTLQMDENGFFSPSDHRTTHVTPFEGSEIDPKSLKVTGIDPFHPLRAAREESQALGHIFKLIRSALKESNCKRAILVGHNATFDLGFVNAAVERAGIKRNPLHPFSVFDTVSFAGLAYGQTVLSKAVQAAGIQWDNSSAHSALYDTQKTAELFCNIVNKWETLHLNSTF